MEKDEDVLTFCDTVIIFTQCNQLHFCWSQVKCHIAVGHPSPYTDHIGVSHGHDVLQWTAGAHLVEDFGGFIVAHKNLTTVQWEIVKP